MYHLGLGDMVYHVNVEKLTFSTALERNTVLSNTLYWSNIECFILLWLVSHNKQKPFNKRHMNLHKPVETKKQITHQNLQKMKDIGLFRSKRVFLIYHLCVLILLLYGK